MGDANIQAKNNPMTFLQFLQPCALVVRRISTTILPGLYAVGLLTLAPQPLNAQSATYFGIVSPLPISGVGVPQTIAFDSKGNLLVQSSRFPGPVSSIVEYSAGSTGYNPPVELPIPTGAAGFFLDENDTLYVPQNRGPIYKYVKKAEGYGGRTTISLHLHSTEEIESGTIDRLGNIFLGIGTSHPYGYYVLEFPKTEPGYGSPVKITEAIYNQNWAIPEGIAVDSVGNLFLFVDDFSDVEAIEIPKQGNEGDLPSPPSGLKGFESVAIDGEGNLYVTENGLLVKWLNTTSGYVPLTIGGIGHVSVGGVALDKSGDLFLASDDNSGEIVKIDSHIPAQLGHAYNCTAISAQPPPCSQTLTMTYSFSADQTLGTPQVASLNGESLDFTLASAGSCVGNVSASSSCSLSVTFAPQAAGDRHGVVEIVDNHGKLLASTPITGLGISTANAPNAQVSPSILQFGTLPYKTTETLPITITNVGGAKLNVASASIDAKSFSITGNTCTAGLGSGQSCTLQVQFNPVHIATFRNSLTVKTNGIAATSKVGLQAIGSGITVDGGPLQFGAVTYGASEALNLTVVNHWLPGAVTLQASATGSSYSFPQNAQNTCSAGIVSGGHCTLPVLFTPHGVGAHNAILTLTPSGGGAPFTLSLHGEGGGLLTGAHFLQFGSIPLGSTAVLPLTVTNSNLPDSVKVQVAASGPSYSVLDGSQNTCQAGVAPGATCTLLIQFSPVGVGLHNGILRLTPSTGGTSISVALDGQATTQ